MRTRYTLHRLRFPALGFTLVEILIVLGILSILSVIAFRQYNLASTTSKAAKARAILRITSIGVEAYKVDAGIYPYDGFKYDRTLSDPRVFWHLGPSISTPIAYLPSADIDDPFQVDALTTASPPADEIWYYYNIQYTSIGSSWGMDFPSLTGSPAESFYYDEILNGMGEWRLLSMGPDGIRSTFENESNWNGYPGYPIYLQPVPYDPTNGLISHGDIILSQKFQHGYYNVP